jgi:hypothetical protein
MMATGKGVGDGVEGAEEGGVARIMFPAKLIPPQIEDYQPIMDPSTWDKVWDDLPVRFKLKSANLLFSTGNDGYSLRTFLEVCSDEAPTVLTIKTMAGHVFGAFVPHPWSQWRDGGYGGYFGSPETFLYSANPGQEYISYKWVGMDADADADPTAAVAKESAYFMYATAQTIALGGGGSGHGIQLDEELNGTSSTCNTFLNACLSGESENFECAAVEVWHFVSRSTI